jgi:hypothetical protein
MNTEQVAGKNAARKQTQFSKKLWYLLPIIILSGLLIFLLYSYQDVFNVEKLKNSLNYDFLIFLGIGIFAQLVDGTLGMGYGATSTSFLLAFGVNPVTSSMAVHVAEMFTTGASALSHYKFKNISKSLVKNLIIPGVIGSAVGAYLLSDVIDEKLIKPYIAIYMIFLAVIIIIKGLSKKRINKATNKKQLGFLAIFGGFMDAVGGGGWGPIVTSTLVGRGGNPRYIIGSVNTAEFAISFASGITFILFGGISGWRVIAGLIIGGVIAAPFGAYFLNKIPRKPMTVLIGLLLIFLSIRTLVKLYP